MMIPTLDLLLSESRVAKVLSFAKRYRSLFSELSRFRKSVLQK
jgi:hypothetical protein